MRFSVVLLGALAGSLIAIHPAAAQQGPGGAINPNRDCQTLLTCNYAKGGRFRGCVSSYSCRRCSFVAARCVIGGGQRQVCRQLRCEWNG